MCLGYFCTLKHNRKQTRQNSSYFLHRTVYPHNMAAATLNIVPSNDVVVTLSIRASSCLIYFVLPQYEMNFVNFFNKLHDNDADDCSDSLVLRLPAPPLSPFAVPAHVAAVTTAIIQRNFVWIFRFLISVYAVIPPADVIKSAVVT